MKPLKTRGKEEETKESERQRRTKRERERKERRKTEGEEGEYSIKDRRYFVLKLSTTLHQKCDPNFPSPIRDSLHEPLKHSCCHCLHSEGEN